MLDAAKFVRSITPRNFLSFGPEFTGIDLLGLNLIIGPNGSGKSNLIEAIDLMRAAPREWRDVVNKGGGVAEWIWKGDAKGIASLEWVVENNPPGPIGLRHMMAFHAIRPIFSLRDEVIENEKPLLGQSEPNILYRYQLAYSEINKQGDLRQLGHKSFDHDKSILGQIRDDETYPELGWLTSSYEKIRIYREWTFGRSAVLRGPQKADLRNDILEEDFSNLGLFLNRMKARFPAAKKDILDGLKDLYEDIHDFEILNEGGTLQVFFIEANGFSIPATRLSDGTLRYLCLLAILCDPKPPPLICLEEPELGLHPDILPKLADYLRAAVMRTQLIVTTHSDILVDEMSNTPEVVVTCEKHNGRTSLKRQSQAELKHWLEKYKLGQLWMSGQIGGTRW